MTGASACRRVIRAKCYAVHSGQFADSEARLILTPCQDEGMSSRTTRGYWKLGAIDCRGALWSEELDDKNSTEHLERERIEGFPFSDNIITSPAYASFIYYTVWYAYFKRLSKLL